MNKLQRHYSLVAALGCIVCRDMGMELGMVQLHHPYGRKREKEYIVLPICFHHHQSGIKSELLVSLHPWKREFEARYGTEEELLIKVKELLNAKT
jgi:hypothetical protein